MAGALPQHVASPPLEITRLRVSGFKSFSEPVELQLEAGLTGVVGPNGCGKSNIVEALRWAMGESSAKGLRGDGMDDVIFNGSTTRPAHDVAEVRLKLRGRPEGLAGFAEEGELEVARRIGRGTGSTYRINGREARARDVQMLFADAGAGARSPAIISQGQIGFIVDSKPADRRKLLEDAAGIGGLQARRREAELRLEATRANLQRVLDLLATQEARLAELAKQGRQAQRYRQLAAELRTTEAHLLLARHAEASRRATDANERVAALGAEHQRQEGTATASRQARADAAGGLPRLREAAASLQARATGLRERLTGLREAAGRDAAHLTALMRQRDEAAQDLQRAERMAAELAEAIRAAEGEAALLTSEGKAGSDALRGLGEADEWAAAALATAQEVVRGSVARAAEAAAQHETARERLAELRRRSAAAQADLAALPTVDQYRDKAQRAERAVADREQALAVAKSRLVELSSTLTDLEPARETSRTASLAAERELTACRSSLAAAELRSRETRAALERWRERGTALERGLARAAERQAAHARRSQGLADAAADADPAARQSALAAAELELAAADAVLDTAREALASAEQQRADAAAAQRDLRRSADALEAEIRVLESLVPAAETGGLLDRLEVPEDLTTALAAALGDDLLAGTEPGTDRYWLQPGAELPPPRLPEGATPLLRLVGGPALLEPRLARIGLVEASEAAALQSQLLPGHRLVSRDGGLWRWDGFVRAPGGEDPAVARVRHRLRLHAAREELAALGQDLVASEASAGACELAVQAARAALAEAEARWRAADTAQLRARQRVDEGLALAERRAAELTQLDEEAAALARDLAELERERLELVAAGEPGDEAATAEAEEAAARIALGEAERRLAAAEAEVGRAEAAWLATQRDVRVLGEAAQRSTVELEQARLVAGADARAAAEQEAERRARAGALERELAELGEALAAADPAATAAGALARERETEQMAAEAALATAEAARRQAAEALTTARGEAAALARRLEGIERGRPEADVRRVEAEAVLAELRQRLQRLEGEVGAGAGEPEIRSGGAGGTRGPAGSRRKRRQRRRATSWLAGRPWRRAWRPSWRRRMRRSPVCASGWRWRSPSAAMPTRRWPPPWPRCATGCSRSRWPCWRTRRPGPRWRRPASRSSMPGSRGCGRRATGWGRSICGPRSRPASSRPPWPTPGRARPSCSRRWTGCGPGSARSTARRGSVCWPRSRRSTGISAACSPCCSAAARHICASPAPTTRSRPVWSWRRARRARSSPASRCCRAARRR